METINPEVTTLIQIATKAIIYSLIPTLVALFLTERIKGRIKSSFDEKLETIKKEHTLEITKFQTELNFFKSRENFKFTKLHEKRLEVLENIYKYINETQNHLRSYIIPVKNLPKDTSYEQNEDVLNENYTKSHNKFVEYYSDNKIYLDEEIEELIDNFIKELLAIHNDYFENQFIRRLGDNGGNQQSFMKAAVAYKRLPENIDPLKKKIQEKFKGLLGD